jgi:hypothetical protein
LFEAESRQVYNFSLVCHSKKETKVTDKSSMAHATTYTTDMLDCLTLIHQGKVRDSFANVGRYRANGTRRHLFLPNRQRHIENYGAGLAGESSVARELNTIPL